MTLSIRQIHPVFVGEVSGIDLRRPLSRDEVAAIDEGMDRYAVLVFRGQMYSRGLLGFTELSDEERAMFRPVRQSLVRAHPKNGRKSLYLASHAGTIVGWPVPEARAFLRDLNEEATRPGNVYTHKWRQYDLVMWDNRQTMHRVRRFDETKVRDMRRTTVAGEAATAQQVAA